MLDVSEICSVEASGKLNYAYTGNQKYSIDHTLEELEERLDASVFVRVHRSSLVNLRFIKEMIPWFSGTYELKLKNNRTVSVSRRRVGHLKKKLGMKS